MLSLRLSMIGVVCVDLLLADDAVGRTPRHTRAEVSLFLGADPHVPLAVVTRGRVRYAVTAEARGRSCGDPARWARVGSRWHTLDEWGQIVGTKVVAAREDPPYDVTACRELTLAPHDARDSARVFVSIDSVWVVPPSAAWSPSAPLRASFDGVVAKEIPDTTIAPSNVPSQCASIVGRTRYFDAAGSHYAVGTTNAGYVIARQDRAAWTVVHLQRSRPSKSDTVCYRPLSIFDMNGDGSPEVVLRMSEGSSWGDFVLSLDSNGRWVEVAASPGGSTA